MSGAEPIRVLVVDDHAVVREGIRHVLSDGAEFSVVGEAQSGAEAVASAARLQPNVVVRVLMLSVHEDLEYVLESLRAGAHGYLRKDSTPAELREAIRALHAGRTYYSPELASQMAEALRKGSEPKAEAPSQATDVLTGREREILVHIAQGKTNKEIGLELGISTRTVEAHRARLHSKFGVRSATELISKLGGFS